MTVSFISIKVSASISLFLNLYKNTSSAMGSNFLLFGIVSILLWETETTTIGFRETKAGSLTEGLPFTNGTTFIITSIMDNSVITVHEDGDVTTEKFRNSPDQRWTVVTHPLDPDSLEFKQEKVPYNMLSGYQDPPENPGTFPRPLGLANRGIVGKTSTWNIKIRGRWCLQANGNGYPMDMDDCEDFVAPWQLWELEEVS